MHQKQTRQSGFTIVELLIVIVVIGILAAITIVAYNGIQNRANDAAVRSDVAQIGKKLAVYYATEGEYPSPTNATQMEAAKLTATHDAYGAPYVDAAGQYNLLICVDNTSTPNAYAVVGASKSGNVFVYSSQAGAETTTNPLVSRNTLCPRYGVTTHQSEWMWRSGTWNAAV